MSDVVDNPAQHRFELTQDGHVAVLVYSPRDDRLTLVHTEVSPELGGRGLGGQLVEAALERARREGLAIVPSCPFATEWLERHPARIGDVTIDWEAP